MLEYILATDVLASTLSIIYNSLFKQNQLAFYNKKLTLRIQKNDKKNCYDINGNYYFRINGNGTEWI